MHTRWRAVDARAYLVIDAKIPRVTIGSANAGTQLGAQRVEAFRLLYLMHARSVLGTRRQAGQIRDRTGTPG